MHSIDVYNSSKKICSTLVSAFWSALSPGSKSPAAPTTSVPYTVLRSTLLAAVLATAGCGSGGSDSDAATEFNPTGNSPAALSGTAVDGPMINATVAVYILDPSSIDLKGRQVATGTTNEKAQLVDVNIPETELAAGTFLVEFSNGTDLTTGLAPVVPTLRTLVNTNQLTLDPQSISASPMTTIALEIARLKMLSDGLSFFNALTEAQRIVRNIYGLGLLGDTGAADETSIDLFTTPALVTESDNQSAALNYRVAIETLVAILDQLQTTPQVAATDSMDLLLLKFAADLSDGDIDGQIDGALIPPLSSLENLVNLATLPPANIAGTDIPLSRVLQLFQDEIDPGMADTTLSAPVTAAILPGVDFDGNGIVDSQESCDPNSLTISGSGTLIGQTSALVNSDYDYSGSATIEGNTLSFTLFQGITNALGQSEITATGFFDLTSGEGETTIIACTGVAEVCNQDVMDSIGVADAFESTTLDSSNPLAVSWSQIMVIDSGAFGLADSESYILAASDCFTLDTDGDGVADDADAFAEDPAASVDSDGDGAPDQWNEGNTAADSTTGLVLDKFPTDAAASVDDDDDGFPDAWNTDKSAADSTSEPALVLDALPGNPDESSDIDGDGVGDNSDAFVNDAAASVDTDADGSPDSWNEGKTVDDSTTGLVLDKFPSDAAASIDDDNDGYPDLWNDGMDESYSTTIPALALDQFLDNGDEWEDTDGDTFGDNLADGCVGIGLGYLDTDGDAVCEDGGATPLDACIGVDLGSINTDGDARCDDVDIPKPDFEPGNPAIQSICQYPRSNYDADPVNQAFWDEACFDTDNDDIADDIDNCPTDPDALNVNSDLLSIIDLAEGWDGPDGLCDVTDTDDDGDGIPDGIDTGSLHPALATVFDPLVQNKYIFEYTLLSSTGVLSSATQSLNGDSSGRLQEVDEPQESGTSAERAATFNVATKTLSWNDLQAITIPYIAISGTNVITADQPAVDLAAGTTTFEGEGTLTGNVFTGTYTQTDVAPVTANVVTWDISVDVTTGIGTQTITACTATGFVDLCVAQYNAVIGDVNPYTATPTPDGFGGFSLDSVTAGVDVDVTFDGIPDGTITITSNLVLETPIDEAVFNLWGDSSLETDGAASGTFTPTHCQYLSGTPGEYFCESIGFDHAESAADWLNPTPPLPGTGSIGTIDSVDFNSSLNTLTTTITVPTVVGDGTVNRTTSYTFSCTNCP